MEEPLLVEGRFPGALNSDEDYCFHFLARLNVKEAGKTRLSSPTNVHHTNSLAAHQ
jgi:hypothetical protein